MATYNDLATIKEESGWASLSDKIIVATQEKARIVIDQTSPTADALAWAKEAIATPVSSARDLENYIVVTNKGQTIATILGASDTNVQNNINSAVDALYGAGS